MWILQGPKKTFRLTAGSVKTVGRATRADFIVDAALVSRVHCRLTATRDGVEVEDLKSTDRRLRRISSAIAMC
jgi:pSer/pThr/pTyr-binding forkhead associated (FHA) protein